MATLYSAREIAVTALEMIGVVAPQDTAADEGKLIKALKWLDMILAEKAGTTRFWFLVPQNATFIYAANATSVDVTSLLGSSNRLDIVHYAYKDDTAEDIQLLTRQEWELARNSGTGRFCTSRALYIVSDGDDTYTAYMLPVPTIDITVRLTGNKFSNDVAKAVKTSTETAHGFEVAWQRWMSHALAADIGDGPLARVDVARLDRWSGIAEASWVKLNSYRGLGVRKTSRFTRAYPG